LLKIIYTARSSRSFSDLLSAFRRHNKLTDFNVSLIGRNVSLTECDVSLTVSNLPLTERNVSLG